MIDRHIEQSTRTQQTLENGSRGLAEAGGGTGRCRRRSALSSQPRLREAADLERGARGFAKAAGGPRARRTRLHGGRGGEAGAEESLPLVTSWIDDAKGSWSLNWISIEQEEGRGNDAHAATIRTYRTQIEAELAKICDGILALLDSHLVPSAGAAESKVFYLKMKGDYHR